MKKERRSVLKRYNEESEPSGLYSPGLHSNHLEQKSSIVSTSCSESSDALLEDEKTFYRSTDQPVEPLTKRMKMEEPLEPFPHNVGKEEERDGNLKVFY